MRQLRYTPRAESDVFEIVESAARTIDLDAAFGIGDRLYDQCEKLAMLPGTLGRPRDDLGMGLRTFPFLSYVIVFQYLEENVLEVARILHSRRDLHALFGQPKS